MEIRRQKKKQVWGCCFHDIAIAMYCMSSSLKSISDEANTQENAYIFCDKCFSEFCFTEAGQRKNPARCISCLHNSNSVGCVFDSTSI